MRLYEHGLKEGGEGADEQARRKQLFDAALLTWLTSVPPDRVGVSRQLQLGVTLVRTAQGFDLDLSTPDAHKTAAAFSPSARLSLRGHHLLNCRGVGADGSKASDDPRIMCVVLSGHGLDASVLR